MRVAVVGSRSYKNLPAVRQYVLNLPKGTIIISGGAKGVDRAGELAAYEAGFEVRIYFPNWQQHGKRAGLICNQQIVNDADLVVAWWDGASTGTAHTISLAKLAKKPFEVYICRRAPVGVPEPSGEL